jgi:hypothetical protein
MSKAEIHEYTEAYKPKNKSFILQGHIAHMVKRKVKLVK